MESTYFTIYLKKVVETERKEGGYMVADVAEQTNYQAQNHLNLVQWVITRHYGGGHNMARRLGLDVEDLFQTGCVGLMRACHQYDPTNEKGASFSTYAIMKIRSELTHAIRDDNYYLKFSMEVRSLASQVAKLEEPTPEKIQAELKVSYETALDLYFYMNRRMTSLHSTTYKTGLFDSILMDEIASTEQAAGEAALRFIELEERLSVLSEKQRNVCYLSLKGLTQKEIAQKLGIRQQLVSEMQRSSVRKIQEVYDVL